MAFVNLGLCRLRLSDPGGGEAVFPRALPMDRRNSVALLEMGPLRLEAGDTVIKTRWVVMSCHCAICIRFQPNTKRGRSVRVDNECPATGRAWEDSGHEPAFANKAPPEYTNPRG